MSIEWIDADYYMSGDFGSLANEEGQFLLFMKPTRHENPYTIIAAVDLKNRWCDNTNEPIKYDLPNMVPIAVAELPRPESKEGFMVKTAKDFK